MPLNNCTAWINAGAVARKPSKPTVTAMCMNNMRRRLSGVSAMLPKVASSIPKATGISEVGNLWPVRM